MTTHSSRKLNRGLTAATLLLASCATANTAYRGTPVSSLSDEQLVTELQSAAAGYGLAFDRSMYLIAIRPEPAYVLTSSTTNLVGSAQGTYNAYVMPTGYGATVTGTVSGTGTAVAHTRYQYTDVNAAARLGNSIALAINRSRQQAYRRRPQEVLQEFQARVAYRRLATQRVIDEFFTANPSLLQRQPLVAVVAPWAAAQGGTDARAILQRTADMIATLPRGQGLTGRWYGAFSQRSTTPNGESITFSEFVRLDLQQQGTALTGSGVLGSGELIELTGTVANQDITAAVANTTSAINVRMTALAAPSQITGTFAGAGAGARMEGNFTLLR